MHGVYREGRLMDGRKRYMVGDTIRLRLTIEHAANLSRLFVAFSHERDAMTEIYLEGAVFVEEPGEGGAKRSFVDLATAVAPETVPGVYTLTRVNIFSASGRLARLREGSLAGAAGASFEVVEEPQEPPKVADLSFVD
jgi:hypothetical protein